MCFAVPWRSLDADVTLLDTGDYYGMGHNALLLRDALRGRDRARVVISIKFGALRDPKGNWIGFDGRPAAVKTFLAYTLRRLGTDYVDIYWPGRLDQAVPIEDTVGAIAELVQAGHVRHVGCRRSGRTRSAGRTRSIRSPISRSNTRSCRAGIEAHILPACRALGVGVTAYARIERAVPPPGSAAGDRYPSAILAHMDSEQAGRPMV